MFNHRCLFKSACVPSAGFLTTTFNTAKENRQWLLWLYQSFRRQMSSTTSVSSSISRPPTPSYEIVFPIWPRSCDQYAIKDIGPCFSRQPSGWTFQANYTASTVCHLSKKQHSAGWWLPVAGEPAPGASKTPLLHSPYCQTCCRRLHLHAGISSMGRPVHYRLFLIKIKSSD